MKRKIPLILLCLLFLGIVGYFGTRLYLEWNEYCVGEKTYEELTQYVYLETSSPTEPMSSKGEGSAEPESPPDDVEMTEELDDINWSAVDFDTLLEITPDVVAWIYIEGTNINYPVVQGEDNSYYLKHLLDGTYNGAGTIFLDYRNEDDLAYALRCGEE